MTVEQLAALKKLSDCFETGIATRVQIQQLKDILAQLNHKPNNNSVVVNANGELQFK